jgi:transcriptional regulator of heat shock response
MTERTSSILDAVVQEFIDAGEPVSSGSLYKRYDFGIKPAMIRLELDALEDAGYLEQPYHSAGRVPTNRGYEFFAKQALGSESGSSREKPTNYLLKRHAWAELVGELSAELGLLSAMADLARDAVYKAGLQELVERLDWEDKAELRSVIRDFEEMDNRIANCELRITEGWNDDHYHDVSVFVGKKSPVTRSECLSVIRGNYQVGDAVVSIFAIGPKKMDYKKVISVLKNL